MPSNSNIFICAEMDGLPVIVGKCPKCNNGDRSLILTDYIPNPFAPENGAVFLQCIGCSSMFKKRIYEVTEEG